MNHANMLVLAAAAAIANPAAAQSLGDSKEAQALDPATIATAIAVASLPPSLQATNPTYTGSAISAASRATRPDRLNVAGPNQSAAPQLSAQQMAALTSQILKQSQRTGTPVVIDIPCTNQGSTRNGLRGNSTTTFCQVSDIYITGD